MARLPTPGSDDGTWGDVLNDFLGVAHNTDGSLADNSVSTDALADAAVTETKLSSAVQTKLNGVGGVSSVNSQTGAVVLDTDDISDTAASNKYVTSAEKTKLANLSGTNTGDQDLSGLVPKTTTVNGHALSSNVSVSKSDVGLGNVDNTSDANKPVSSATQTALNAKVDSSTTYSADPSGQLITVVKNYTTQASSQDILRIYNNAQQVSWINEWGGWRWRIPDAENWDAAIRIIAAANQTGKMFQVQNSTRTSDWMYIDKDGSIATVADLTVGGTATISGAASTGALTASSGHITGNLNVDGNLTVSGSFGGGGSGFTIQAVQSTTPSTSGWTANQFWYDTSTET